MTSETSESYSDLDGHTRIPELLNELEAATTAVADARRTLTSLRDELKGHFELEERPGGFFEGLRNARPDNQPKVKKLTDEHGVILENVHGLLGDLEGGKLEEALGRIKALCKTIRDHDESEYKLYTESNPD